MRIVSLQTSVQRNAQAQNAPEIRISFAAFTHANVTRIRKSLLLMQSAYANNKLSTNG